MFLSETSAHRGFSIAMFDYQRGIGVGYDGPKYRGKMIVHRNVQKCSSWSIICEWCWLVQINDADQNQSVLGHFSQQWISFIIAWQLAILRFFEGLWQGKPSRHGRVSIAIIPRMKTPLKIQMITPSFAQLDRNINLTQTQIFGIYYQQPYNVFW